MYTVVHRRCSGWGARFAFGYESTLKCRPYRVLQVAESGRREGEEKDHALHAELSGEYIAADKHRLCITRPSSGLGGDGGCVSVTEDRDADERLSPTPSVMSLPHPPTLPQISPPPSASRPLVLCS